MPSLRWMPMRRGPEWARLSRLLERGGVMQEAYEGIKFPDIPVDPNETDVLASVKIEEV